MPRITVASKNPVKLNATRAAFGRMFARDDYDVVGVSVPSGVADQPMSRGETMAGALARAENARAARRESDFWVGIEGGIEDSPLGMTCFAWVVVLDRSARIGRGQTAVFFLPEEVARLVRGGMELGHADDVVFKRDNSKQANGAIGLLTDDVVDREAYYVHALIMALVPFKNPELSW
ncbi:MAG: inosine/xanthosine triphosphatase [Chloroflexi bacterium]|nr:inosine/xanthosine triphosphatase [Chloroflexota bacterium]